MKNFMDLFQQHFARVLREWRVNQRRKIADVAGEVGVSIAAWAQWESGSHLPSTPNLIKLSQFTGISVQHFVCPESENCPLAKRAPGTQPRRLIQGPFTPREFGYKDPSSPVFQGLNKAVGS